MVILPRLLVLALIAKKDFYLAQKILTPRAWVFNLKSLNIEHIHQTTQLLPCVICSARSFTVLIDPGSRSNSNAHKKIPCHQTSWRRHKAKLNTTYKRLRSLEKFPNIFPIIPQGLWRALSLQFAFGCLAFRMTDTYNHIYRMCHRPKLQSLNSGQKLGCLVGNQWLGSSFKSNSTPTTTNNQQPTINNQQQPTTNNQQPTTNN